MQLQLILPILYKEYNKNNEKMENIDMLIMDLEEGVVMTGDMIEAATTKLEDREGSWRCL